MFIPNDYELEESLEKQLKAKLAEHGVVTNIRQIRGIEVNEAQTYLKFFGIFSFAGRYWRADCFAERQFWHNSDNKGRAVPTSLMTFRMEHCHPQLTDITDEVKFDEYSWVLTYQGKFIAGPTYGKKDNPRKLLKKAT